VARHPDRLGSAPLNVGRDVAAQIACRHR
jgi:hypothetical protein